MHIVLVRIKFEGDLILLYLLNNLLNETELAGDSVDAFCFDASGLDLQDGPLNSEPADCLSGTDFVLRKTYGMRTPSFEALYSLKLTPKIKEYDTPTW